VEYTSTSTANAIGAIALGAGNTIAFNGGDGVRVFTNTGLSAHPVECSPLK
jgi:hypothetical protein